VGVEEAEGVHQPADNAVEDSLIAAHAAAPTSKIFSKKVRRF